MRCLGLVLVAGCGISEQASLDEFRVGTLSATIDLDTGNGLVVATTLDDAGDRSCPELRDDVYAFFDSMVLRFEARGRFVGSKSSPAICESARAVGAGSGDLAVNRVYLQDPSDLVEMQVAHYFAPRSLVLVSPLGAELRPDDVIELDWNGPEDDPIDQRLVFATFDALGEAVEASWTGNRAQIRVPTPLVDDSYDRPMALAIRAHAGARVIACDADPCKAELDFTALEATVTLVR